MMEIQLRLIQQDNIEDRKNYFILQKSVALFPDQRLDFQEGYEDKSWQDQFENINRICYVIETIPEKSYCGECAVKDISAEIPEIEIELMKEYRYQGIGYKAILMLLGKVAKQYGKRKFYARIEPDNYASQFLFEKLKGVPAGLTKDRQISDERAEKFIEMHRDLLDERIQDIAKRFGIKADLLLTHLLVYKLDFNDIQTDILNESEIANKRTYIECRRKLSKEKFKDSMKEFLEDLEELQSYGDEKDKINVKIADMEAKLLAKIEQLGSMELDFRKNIEL